MAKADLLKWIMEHDPPLRGTCPKTPPNTYTIPESECTRELTDYDRFNAVTNEATARLALEARCPPLTPTQVEEAMVQYLL